MGLNNENAARMVFDIETAPLPEAVDYIEQAEAPANYKDLEKIAAFVKEKNAENLSRCGLDADLCRVVAMGWQIEGDSEVHSDVVKGNECDERSLLTAFWMNAAGKHLIGFNCLGFDLPVLLRRSLYLEIKTPDIAIDRFKHPQVTDLMQVLSFNGTLKLRGLSFYAKRFGLDIPDTLTGADIVEAVEKGRWSEVEAHVRADVQKTAALAERLGYFRAVSLVL
jgi:predicted PolB exonuclease-like 3'-5' exonuclease